MTHDRLDSIARYVKMDAVYRAASIRPGRMRKRKHDGTPIPPDEADAIRAVLRRVRDEITRAAR